MMKMNTIDTNILKNLSQSWLDEFNHQNIMFIVYGKYLNSIKEKNHE